ncbi:MAG TPA: TMEM175 family protein [Methanoregula sp.]|nr:TMEM175 family protein [Methanoregula sp.]
MNSEEDPENTFISKNRLEALVDGVFAFAMTLLAVSLSVPSIPKSEAATELPVYMNSMFPEFLSFVIAFFILASFWIVHHEHFHFLHSVNKFLLWLNILILIFVVLVPFSTNLSGDYAHVQIASIVFHVNMLVLGLLFFIQWQYIIRSPSLLNGIVHPNRALDSTLYRSSIVIAAITGIILTFFMPSYSMFSYLFVPLIIRISLWICLPRTRPFKSGQAKNE